MLSLSHVPLVLASALALALSIPSATLRPIVIFPLPFCYTPALTFFLDLATALIISIPLASTWTLDSMEALAICVIYFALASDFGTACALLGLSTSIVTISSY